MPLPNHIPLTQLGAGETSSGMSSPVAGPFQHRHTTRLMQELSSQDFSSDEELDSGEEDIADDGKESVIEDWQKEGAQPRSGGEIAEGISSTPCNNATDVLSPLALAE